MFEIAVTAFVFFIGLAVVVGLFGNDKQSQRAERILRALLGVMKRSHSGEGDRDGATQ